MNATTREAPPLVLVVGAACSGRTCAVVRFLQDRFMEEYDPQIDLAEHRCTVGGTALALVDGPAVLLDPETAWLDREYDALLPRAVGVLALFDVTRRETLADLRTVVARTQELRRARGLAPLPVAVLGTCTDLTDARTVPAADARAAAAEIGASYAEISARTGENVRTAFTDAITAFVASSCPNDNGGSPRDRQHHRGCSHQ